MSIAVAQTSGSQSEIIPRNCMLHQHHGRRRICAGDVTNPLLCRLQATAAEARMRSRAVTHSFCRNQLHPALDRGWIIRPQHQHNQRKQVKAVGHSTSPGFYGSQPPHMYIGFSTFHCEGRSFLFTWQSMIAKSLLARCDHASCGPDIERVGRSVIGCCGSSLACVRMLECAATMTCGHVNVDCVETQYINRE